LDVLNEEWTPALTARAVLISIQALLSAPEPNDPIDFVAAEQLKMSQTIFEAKVKEKILMKRTYDEANNILSQNYRIEK
jgi:ubiquitin-conjugating enzyme E2 N